MNRLLKTGIVLALVVMGPLTVLDSGIRRVLLSREQEAHFLSLVRRPVPSGKHQVVYREGPTDLSTMKMNRTGVIHLGKCGGVSLKRTIGYKPKANKIAEGFPWFYHMAYPNITMHHTWIALIRDPMARVASAYIYEHLENRPFRVNSPSMDANIDEKRKLFDCYPTLDSLVTIGLREPSLSMNDCPMLARRLFMGPPVSDMTHFTFNFALYYTDLLADPEKHDIYVVRTETMLQDLKQINVMMGGSEDSFTDTARYEHFTTENLPVTDRSMSDEGRRNLCRMICSEILIYKTLLIEGLNTKNNTTSALSSIAAQCPEEVQMEECPALPHIKEGIQPVHDIQMK